MMFAKTVCNKPGSYVEVVPAGLLARLQYNKDGLLEKIYVGINSMNQDLDLKCFRNAEKYVPAKISAVGGTTWIDGVFYPAELSNAPGHLPECCYTDYLNVLAEDKKPFTYYAGHVESLAVSLTGVLATRNWLQINRFNVLPGVIIPFEMTEDTIKNMVDRETRDFRYPYLSGFMVFEGLDYRFETSGLTQATVKSVSTQMDEYGYVRSAIKTNFEPLTLNYSDVVANDIQTATLVLYYEDNSIEIVASRKTDTKKRDSLSPFYVCPACKKKYPVPQRGLVHCDDENCISRIYPNICRFLSTLKFDAMSVDRFKEVVSNHSMTCLTDVLYLSEYKDKKPVLSLANAIKAVTPATVCADESFFMKLANSCNNSVDTLMYYMQNPLRIQTDLEINSIQGRQFIEWIQEPGNILTLHTLLVEANIQQTSKKFEGAPIFRGKSFVITGKFRHGDHEDIVSILESYSGKVLDDIEPTLPDSVIVGSIKDGVNGRVVQAARFAGVPVFEEDDFFAWNNIDADLKANLL